MSSPSLSTSDSSCNRKCQLGWGIGFGIFVFICGGYLLVYAVGIVLLGMIFLIWQWATKAGKWLWGRLKKGSARIKGWLLVPVWYWYGVRDQTREKRKTVIVDGRVTELKLFDRGELLAEEKVDRKEGSIGSGSDMTLVEGVALWTRLYRLAASPIQLLRKVRPRQLRQVDIEKNDISPATSSEPETKLQPTRLEAPRENIYCRHRDMMHLKAHFSALRPHRPRILHAVWRSQKTQHAPSKIGQEFVSTAVSLTTTGPSAKMEHFQSPDSLEIVNEKEGSIGSDRTLAEKPSIWRRIRNLFPSSRGSQPAADSQHGLEEDFRQDCKKDMSSPSSSSTMVGSEDYHISKRDLLTLPKPVYTALTNCGREYIQETCSEPRGHCPDPLCSLPTWDETTRPAMECFRHRDPSLK